MHFSPCFTVKTHESVSCLSLLSRNDRCKRMGLNGVVFVLSLMNDSGDKMSLIVTSNAISLGIGVFIQSARLGFSRRRTQTRTAGQVRRRRYRTAAVRPWRRRSRRRHCESQPDESTPARLADAWAPRSLSAGRDVRHWYPPEYRAPETCDKLSQDFSRADPWAANLRCVCVATSK